MMADYQLYTLVGIAVGGLVVNTVLNRRCEIIEDYATRVRAHILEAKRIEQNLSARFKKLNLGLDEVITR